MSNLTIVTGGSSGIGAEIAQQAAADDSEVIVVSRRPGAVGRHVSIDLATLEGWDAFDDLLAALPQADSVDLYHCAGTLTPIGFAGEVDAASYRGNVLLNSAGAQVVGDAFLRAAGDSRATLVMITSGAARTAYPGWSAYCAGKAAIDLWVRTVGAEQAERNGAKVVAIAPGVVDTPMQTEIRETEEDQFPNVDRFRRLHSEGDLADPADVARRIRQAVPTLSTGAVVDLRDL